MTLPRLLGTVMLRHVLQATRQSIMHGANVLAHVANGSIFCLTIVDSVLAREEDHMHGEVRKPCDCDLHRRMRTDVAADAASKLKRN